MRSTNRYNYSKLRGKIKEKFGTEQKFAMELGISTVSLSKRLNNQLYFDVPEVHRACDLLQIQIEEVSSYFFYSKC